MNKQFVTDDIELNHLLNLLGDVISFDTETSSLKYSELELDGFSVCDGNIIIYSTCPLPKNFLETRKMIIMHNSPFDMKVMHKFGIDIDKINLFDTMVAEHLIDEREEYGLKYLAKKYLNAETKSYEEARKKGVNSKEFIEYAMNDAEWTFQIAQIQNVKLKELQLEKLFTKIEMPFQKVLTEMEVTGVLIDKKRIEETLKLINKKIFSISEEMYKSIGVKYYIQHSITEGDLVIVSDLNLNSSDQVGDILFNKLGLPVIETTPGGKPSVGTDTLLKLKDRHKFVELLYQYKTLQKLKSSFFEPLPSFIEQDGRIRAHFNDCGTETGRLSSNSPNLQQLPRADKDMGLGTRDCFIVPEGYEMITCDYGGQEIRVMAQESKDHTLVDALIKGQDMHLKIANQFYGLGIPEECLYETNEEYEKYKKKFKTERTRAKTITFGLSYGKTAFGFSQDFNISESEAQALVDKYFSGMPKLSEAINKAQKEVKEKGYVKTLSGRYRHFDMIEKNGKKFYTNSSLRQAFNFKIQGFSADMIRKASNLVYEESKKHPEYELKTLMSIHDEMVYQCRKEYINECSEIIERCFITAVKFIVPVVVEIGHGNSYGNAK